MATERFNGIIIKNWPNLMKKESPIHGIGIYTSKHIARGDIFYRVPTDSIFCSASSGLAYIGGNLWVDDKSVLNYVNHSCNPNSILDISGSPILVSKRGIFQGDEITVDYNKTEPSIRFNLCRCGEMNCRDLFKRENR